MTPLVSLLLLAHNKVAFTRTCLRALLRTTYPHLELWLINNGSTDATTELFDEVEDQLAPRVDWHVHRIEFAENQGAVAGRNAALKHISGTYCVWMDNDIAATDPSWLQRLVRRATQDPGLALVGPKLVYPKPAHTIQCAGCAVTPSGRVQFVGRGEDDRTPEYNCEREVQCLISACWLMRSELVSRIGLLDMAFHPVQFEDIDYCYRARAAGYRLLYYPAVSLYHFENITTGGTGSLNYRYLTVKNGLLFKRRWRHMFSVEDGPCDEAVVWRDLPKVSWHDVEALLD